MPECKQYIFPLNEVLAISLLKEIQRTGTCNREMLSKILKELPDGTAIKNALVEAIIPKEGIKPKTERMIK